MRTRLLVLAAAVAVALPAMGQSSAQEPSPAEEESPADDASATPPESADEESGDEEDADPQGALPEGVHALVGEPGELAGEVTELFASTASIYGDLDGVTVTETPDGVELTTAADVVFDFGSAELGPDAAAALDEATRVIQAARPAVVQVIGHTDGIGTSAQNERLSLARAEAVAAVLRADPSLEGITFEPVGRGAEEPVLAEQDEAGNDLPDARARNRRVELRFSATR